MYNVLSDSIVGLVSDIDSGSVPATSQSNIIIVDIKHEIACTKRILVSPKHH
ncbi:hypothetical protein OENI_580004 [Oenococcus oeni]|nr:hypothetical protein OENI_580004 [Oenococcus oeni]